MLAGPVDLVIQGEHEQGKHTEQPAGAVLISVGTTDSSPGLALPWPESLAMRLALLTQPYGQPASLGPFELKRAKTTLTRWRELVCRWAQRPSVATPGDVVARVRVAVDDNLDVPAALSVLHAVEDDMTISPGAKFETFLYQDRILGLDLGRDLGRHATNPRHAP